MSWQIKQEGSAALLVLESEIGILNAADFHQAVLPLADGGAVRVDARAVTSIHLAIMQTLYALSQAVPEFGVTQVSEEFRAAEARVGLSLARSKDTGTPANRSGQT